MTRLTAEAVEGFVGHYLLDTYADPRPFKQFHREVLQDCCATDPHVADALPRGHSKSATVNLGYSLAAAMLRFEPYQIKVSRTRSVCCSFLQSVKWQLSDNEKLRTEFGILPVKEWEKDTEDDFICNFEDGYQIRMTAFGCEQPMRGTNWRTKRPGLVICDDMEDDEQVLNPDRREKVWNWFMGTLLPIGTPETKFRVIGTVLHAESLLQRLLESDEWKSRTYEACDAEVSETSLLWPELWSKTRLEKMKKLYIDSGNLVKFNMEYRNIAVDLSSGYFQAPDFVENERTDTIRRMTYYVGVDYAISTADRRDFTVMVVGGVDEDGFLEIVDLRKGRWDGKQILDEMFAIHDAFKPEQWFVESGSIQKALGAALEMQQRQRNVYLPLNLMIPTKDKASRARSIQARMRSKAVRFDKRNAWFDDLQQEMLQFPRGRHDDQVDAMAWLGLGLAEMVTPMTDREYEDDQRAMQKQQRDQSPMMITGRSSVTGY